MINQVLDTLKSQLEADPSIPCVEVTFKDISQYKFISQNPVVVINFRGGNFEKPPHHTISGKKGVLDISIFIFLRTIADDSNAERIMGLFESVKALEYLELLCLRPYSHKKNTLVWELKAQIEKVF